MFTTTHKSGIKSKVNGKKKFFFILITSLFILYLICNLNSCTSLNEEDILKDVKCDTIDVSYNELKYIFTGICSICHNEVSTFRAGIVMDSYKNVVSSINTGLVLPAINHADGVIPMPNGMAKLSDCDLAKINSWIKRGMPENK